ncbi:MAG: hypothetical protein ACFFDT_31450 [Candidatus Hodarchaeota archaeon]
MKVETLPQGICLGAVDTFVDVATKEWELELIGEGKGKTPHVEHLCDTDENDEWIPQIYPQKNSTKED